MKAVESLTTVETATYDPKYQHASCCCNQPKNVYPMKSLCGKVITNNDTSLPKCPACLLLFGKSPCPLCPVGCTTC
jgi:hypothetical protein